PKNCDIEAMVNLKSQYKRDIGVSGFPYYDHEEAKSRMVSIHGSSRQRMCISGPILWNCYFDQLWDTRQSIPSEQASFESWFKSQIVILSRIIAEHRLNRYCPTNFYSIGMAQKCLNLFLKDLWAFDAVKEAQYRHFHAVIDRKVLYVLLNKPESWEAWSKVIAQDEREFEVLYADYLRIQKCLNSLQRHYDSEFSNVLELEQFIWHFVNNDCAQVVKDKLTKHLRVIPNA
ncbi:TPA: hypothetical protein NKQ35_004766, partial [Vibrio parahaemolyticus]|nr:hypothetical protein [Vibrio parahaemolyticus]